MKNCGALIQEQFLYLYVPVRRRDGLQLFHVILELYDKLALALSLCYCVFQFSLLIEVKKLTDIKRT